MRKPMRIFAIESPSALDILDKKTESNTLATICGMLEHQFASTLVRSKTEFETAIAHVTSINESFLARRQQGMPLCLHIAAHGNKDGLALGPTDASWSYLASKLRAFSRSMNHYSGPLLLVLSACGANHQEITDYFQDYVKEDKNFRPALYVFTTVGNEEDNVYWHDSIIAWSIFYHQIATVVLSERKDIMTILDKIKIVGAGELQYFRWDETREQYFGYQSKHSEHKHSNGLTSSRSRRSRART